MYIFFAEISIYFSTGLRTRYVNLEELPLKLYLRRLLAFVSKSFLNRNALATSPESFEFSNFMQIFNFKTRYTVQILAKNKPDQDFTGWAEFRLQSRDARVCFF